MPETIAIAGASGFIGSALGPVLGRNHHVIGLSRSERQPGNGFAEWRQADLFSLRDAERALAGADRAIYLVHSMLPTDRLVQGDFEDFDLLCADNFARAAAHAGVRQIIYLGGILPDDPHQTLSRHLASRRETEEALAAHGVPLTTLRAGLVIGRGGSSFVMMERLVRRLPAMLCPTWTQTLTQPVALGDVVKIIEGCLGRDDVLGGTYDIGCPEILSYREMMKATAEELGLRRPMMKVPFLTTGLSRLWVSLVTGAPKALVKPLVQSLVHPMIARNLELQERLGLTPTPMRVALRKAIAPEPDSKAKKKRKRAPKKKPDSLVRSIQRMPLPTGRDAEWVANEYMRWLPRALRPVMRVEVAEGECDFYLWPLKEPMLKLCIDDGDPRPDRQSLAVIGGSLACVEEGSRARLEFQEVNEGEHVLAAVHDFKPRLPWMIYVVTQAQMHRLVMAMFRRKLSREPAVQRDETVTGDRFPVSSLPKS